MGSPELQLLDDIENAKDLRYALEVYVDDFMAIIIPTSKAQVEHVARAVMAAIHDVFPASKIDADDPISEKKMKKGEGMMSTKKSLLGFEFDGIDKTLWLESEKRDVIITTLHKWIRAGSRHRGIPFKEFESIMAKIRHAFTALPAAIGLLSGTNSMLRKRPEWIYLHKEEILLQEIMLCKTLFLESTREPTRCKELIRSHPDFVGICDASSHGVGGIIVGETESCLPTVFRLQWPTDISNDIKSLSNPTGRITNSDLEMAGLLLLWLVIEATCGNLNERNIALFSDNSPTVSWVSRLTSRQSTVASRLLGALTLRLKHNKCCPLTPMHIKGDENAITDIPSRSFGSNTAWNFRSHHDLQIFFNTHFSLPKQNSWTVFQLNSKICMRVISILRMRPFELADWRRLPKIGQTIGPAGYAMSNLWELTLTYRIHRSNGNSELSLDSQQELELARLVQDERSKLAQSLGISRPLVRRSLWPVELTP